MLKTPQSVVIELLNIDPFPGLDPDVLYPYIAHRLSRLEFDVLFPYGKESLINEYFEYIYQKLLNDIQSNLPKDVNVTEKIRWMIYRHLQHLWDYQYMFVHVYTLPLTLSRHIARVVDMIWIYAGDQSTDMNYYTKRASLATIYGATLIYGSVANASLEETKLFFDERMDHLKQLMHILHTSAALPKNLIKNIRLLQDFFFNT